MNAAPLHRRKKLEIVVEALRAREVTAFVEARGATGYTVLPVIEGKGHRGHRTSGDISSVGETVLVVVIAGEEASDRILADAAGLLRDSTAILYVSDVQVVRGDHF